MDTDLLVDDLIAGGRKLAAELVRDGLDVTAVGWLKPRDAGRWYLYIASKGVDEKGALSAYRAVHAALQRLPGLGISSQDIKVVGADQPLTKAMLEIEPLQAQSILSRFREGLLGDVVVDDVYIYPPSAITAAPFDVIARGKEEVLRYLEGEAQSRAGTPGEYLLARDDAGKLVAVIAGHPFVGSGTVTIDGNRLVIANGIVVAAQQR
jgi:hypothetical protein